MTYYSIEKYRIVIGNEKSGTALCVGWNDSDNLVQEQPKLLKQCHIIGSLFLPDGINAVIRNLALNPSIQVLYMWRFGETSRTKVGIRATETLLQVWENGVNKLRTYGDFTLEKEIPLEVFNTVRASVEIRVVDSVPPDKLTDSIVYSEEQLPYMTPQKFPEPAYQPPSVYPSEGAGFMVHQETVEEAWLQVLHAIIRYGALCGSQNLPTKRLRCITWVIHNEIGKYPSCENIPIALQERVSAAPEMLDEYVGQFLNPDNEKSGATYTYGGRLRKWGGSFDQLNAVIKLLREQPGTRQAYVSIFEPNIDLSGVTQPPCLVGIQFCPDSGRKKLDAIATFRSHDIFGAGIPNAFGLLETLQYVAGMTGNKPEKLIICSHDAHIYERDIEDARKLTECIWGQPPAELSEEEMDPRGSFIIRILNGRITVDFIDSVGQTLEKFSGTNADELNRQIGMRDLIGYGRSDHAIYLGVQLAIAEWCLIHNKPYEQDKPPPYHM